MAAHLSILRAFGEEVLVSAVISGAMRTGLVSILP